jgi:UDP-N-acetylglucosamine 1-carboxyvinyltransferase
MTTSRREDGRDEILRIEGGRELRGRIAIGGSKNATLPILAATLLTAAPVKLTNLAEVTDTRAMLDILRHLGCAVTENEGEVTVTASDPGYEVPIHLAREMRASLLLLGPLLSRVGSVRLPRPGGDDIGARRVEQHIGGLRRMGADVEETETEFIARAVRLRGARITLDMPTVTGTENLMMAAVLAEGRTEILNAAREPHVQDLARFLNAIGARVVGAGTDEVVIEGVEQPGGGSHTVRADYLESGTYAIAAAATGGEVILEGSPSGDLATVLLKLEQVGVSLEVDEMALRVSRGAGGRLRATDLTTWVHPGFPTDLQSQYTALMTQAHGDSIVSEYLFENRFQHVPELLRMGARITVHGRDCYIHGPSRLHGIDVLVPDIRSGAALVIAALCARGVTELHQTWHVDRGYQDLVGKLTTLGARIERRDPAGHGLPSTKETYE